MKPTDRPKATAPRMRRRDNWRLIAIILVALAAALAVYAVAEAGAGGAIGYALMVVLPASLSAFVA